MINFNFLFQNIQSFILSWVGYLLIFLFVIFVFLFKSVQTHVWNIQSEKQQIYWIAKLVDFLCFRKKRTKQSLVYQNLKEPSNIWHERMQNYLLGVSIGDAFGAGVEMGSRDWITQNVKFDRYVEQKWSAWSINYVLGDYTDDTEQTIANCKLLMDKSNSLSTIDENEMLKYWKLEFEETLNWLFIGRKGHGSIKDYFYYGKNALESVKKRQSEKKYPGNAPPMRATPFGFISSDEKLMIKLCILNADASHPHPKARAASILVAFATQFFMILRKNPKNIIIESIEFIKKCPSSSWDQETIEYLQEIETMKPWYEKEIDYKKLVGNDQGLEADSLRTLGSILYFLKYGRNSFELLKQTILVGGDVDSLAAICLGLWGGRYGFDFGKEEIGGLPWWILDPLEGIEYVQEIAKRFSEFYLARS